MSWASLILEVRAQKIANPDDWAVGTAFPVDRGLVLTARHVVIEDAGVRGGICARWEGFCGPEHFDPETRKAWPGGGFLPAEVVWDDPGLDLALLRIPHPEHAGAIHLARSVPDRSADRATRGFPHGAKIGTQPTGYGISGTLQPGPLDQAALQFDPRDPPKVLAQFGGLSGGPLIDEETGHASGVIVRAREALENARSLEVVPSAAILDCEGFVEKLNPWRKHKPTAAFDAEFLDCIRTHLTRRLVALDAPSRDRLARCALDRRDVPGDLQVLIDDMLEASEDCLERIAKAQPDTYRSDPQFAASCGRIGQILFLDMLDDEARTLISYLRERREDANADPFAGIASTVTFLEALAAAIDGLEPEFPPKREHRSDEPRSPWMLPSAMPETGGIEEDPAVRQARSVAGRLGIPLMERDLEREVEYFMRNQQIIRPAEIADRDRDFDRIARQISVALAEAQADDERSYFVPVMRIGDSAQDGRFGDRLRALRAKIPQLLLLGFLPDESRSVDERERLSALYRTVPVVRTET